MKVVMEFKVTEKELEEILLAHVLAHLPTDQAEGMDATVRISSYSDHSVTLTSKEEVSNEDCD